MVDQKKLKRLNSIKLIVKVYGWIVGRSGSRPKKTLHKSIPSNIGYEIKIVCVTIIIKCDFQETRIRK
jgi:hypothetical protein